MAKAKATIKSVVVVLEHTPDAPAEYKWSVHCPAIPACFSEGRTREEALKNIREVLSAYWELKASAYTARR
jgi:predicted RNase H-like HicB family nuclease